MTQLSQPRRTRIVPPTPIDPEVIQREREAQQSLRERGPLFEAPLRDARRREHPSSFAARLWRIMISKTYNLKMIASLSM